MSMIVSSKYRVRLKIADSFVWEATVEAFPQHPNVRETVAARAAIVFGRYAEGLPDCQLEVESVEDLGVVDTGWMVMSPTSPSSTDAGGGSKLP